MTKPRVYAFRHPRMGDAHIQTFEASARIWITHTNAIVHEAPHLAPFHDMPLREEWEPYATAPHERLDDTSIGITISGGPPTYGWLKAFEDDIPNALYRYQPLWFQLDLEIARLMPAMGFDSLHWSRLRAQDEADVLRQHPAFREPVE